MIGKGINNTILLKFKYFYVYKISLWSKKISYSIIKVTFEEKIRKKHIFYCYVTPSQIVRKNIFFSSKTDQIKLAHLTFYNVMDL